MSRQKISLHFEDPPRSKLWWALIAAAVGGLSFMLGNWLFQNDQKVLLDAPPIEALGMQELDYFAELNRQELAPDFQPSQEESLELDAEQRDPYLIQAKINKNQTLFSTLKNHGLDLGDVHQVIAAMQKVVDFKRSKPGDKYRVHLDGDRRIVKFVYEISPEDISVAERQDEGFQAYKLDVKREEKAIYLTGTLNSSLYQAFVDLGESGELATHFMQLFKYDFDFGSQSQGGDQFGLLVEKITLDGKFYRYGRVWMAHYEQAQTGQRLEAYYYDGNENDKGYYDARGRAMKRSFLKVPVVGCTMTSPFNPKRFHPVLKRVRPHYGIDWAGPTGTPVMAFADGSVSFAGWKGGNGNLLIIEHSNGYTSIYAHLHGFARGVKVGAQVKLGQVVAYIGNTGISTGPHLHFGVKKDGQYIDPAKIDANHAFMLTGQKLQNFQQQRDALRLRIHEAREELVQEEKRRENPEGQQGLPALSSRSLPAQWIESVLPKKSSEKP